MKTALTLAAIAACCATHHPDVMGQTINDNGRVTFTYRDKNANEVDLELYIDGERETAEMDDAGDGVWIYTTSHNVPSDMTTYRFKINDEHYRLDPGNPNVVRDIKDSLNYFIIPGDPGSLYQDQNVRHGQVTALWYYSHFDPSIQQRRLKVYLPYAYLADTTLRLPVLYLLHGTGGDEDSWCDMGRLAQIMDNLIAQGRCAPMIVVMPNGTVEQDAAPGSSRNKYSQVEQSNRISWSGKNRDRDCKSNNTFHRQKPAHDTRQKPQSNSRSFTRWTSHNWHNSQPCRQIRLRGPLLSSYPKRHIHRQDNW